MTEPLLSAGPRKLTVPICDAQGECSEVDMAEAVRGKHTEPAVAQEFIVQALRIGIDQATIDTALTRAGFPQRAVIQAERMVMKARILAKASLVGFGFLARDARNVDNGILDATARKALDAFREAAALDALMSFDQVVAIVNEKASDIQSNLRDFGFPCPLTGVIDGDTIWYFSAYQTKNTPATGTTGVGQREVDIVPATLDLAAVKQLAVAWTAKSAEDAERVLVRASLLAEHNLERQGYLPSHSKTSSPCNEPLRNTAGQDALKSYLRDIGHDPDMPFDQAVKLVNDRVLQTQEQLRDMSIACPKNGKLDDATLRAIAAFKRKEGLPDPVASEGVKYVVSDVVDQATLEKINQMWIQNYRVFTPPS